MKIGFFGAGNMVRALALAIKSADKFNKFQFYFFTPSHLKAKKLAEETNGIFIEFLDEMPKNLDLYFLGFKPQNLSEFEFNFNLNTSIISILAGTELKQLEAKFTNVNFARFMPNIPCEHRAGMNLIHFSKEFNLDLKNQILNMLESLGKVIDLNSENDLDLLTPFSGSGPGLIFELANYFEQSLINIMNKNNIKNVDTRSLVSQTFYGSSLVMLKSNKSFLELRDQVTSKKGVTYEALKTMQERNMNLIMEEAFVNAINRVKELKRGL